MEQEVFPSSSFREGDYVAYRFGFAKDGHEAVETYHDLPKKKKRKDNQLRYEGIGRKGIGSVSSHDTATRSGCIVLEGKGEGEGKGRDRD